MLEKLKKSVVLKLEFEKKMRKKLKLEIRKKKLL